MLLPLRHMAAEGDSAALIDALLQAGASPRAVNRFGVVPFFYACMCRLGG